MRGLIVPMSSRMSSCEHLNPSSMGLHLRRWFSRPNSRRVFNRGCSVLLTGASIGLLASRRT
jgi:hypothetical protein